MPKVTINGQTYEAEKGRTIIQVADEIGVRPLKTRSLGPIADNHQPTAKPLDRVGMIQDLGEVFLSRDSANEPKHNRLGILIA